MRLRRAIPVRFARPNPHVLALGQALLVTVLWSTSWVLIKVGLRDLDLPPLGFAGLRYTLAAAILLPFAFGGLRATGRRLLDARLLARVAALGLLFYYATQGTQFVALGLLPAVAVSLVLTATPALVALLTLRTAGERASAGQVVGIAGLLAGAALYFGPIDLGPTGGIGLAVALASMLANALSALLGRSLAQQAQPQLGGVLLLTALSMGLGGLALLATGLAFEGLPRLSPTAWAIVAWLAVVNTAFAFTLWNHTLKVLSAVQSSVVNNLMLVEIAALAWVFLGEALDARQVAGLVVATAGVLLVQVAPALAAARRGS